MVKFDFGQTERLRAIIERSTVTVASADHAVSVTVSPGGAITRLKLTDRAMRHNGRTLAGLIASTIVEATSELDERLGADLDTVGDRTDRTDGTGGDDLTHLVALLSGSVPQPPKSVGPPTCSTGATEPLRGDRAGEGPEALLERLRADSDRSLDGYVTVREELADATTSARSADGSIEVTVRSGGAVRDIHIEDTALRHGPKNLGRLVLGTIQRARAEAALRATEQGQEFSGSTLPTLPTLDLVQTASPPEPRPDDDRNRRGHR